MLAIRDSRLRIELLDPHAVHPAQGSRSCRGGYIWQVHDAQGPLLSGPEFPQPPPTSCNGQGLPEVFRHADKRGDQPLTRLHPGGCRALRTGTLDRGGGRQRRRVQEP